MSISKRRIPWTYLISGLLLAILLTILIRNWDLIRVKAIEAIDLCRAANPIWLALAAAAILGGFLCAGQIYGRVMATLGHRAPSLWLSAAAMVTILLSQALPVGTVASYAFLTTSLRRRGVPASSVAVIASLELLSWGGAMLILFVYGMLYVLATTSSSIGGASLTGFATVAVLIGVYLFVGSRSRETLHSWAMRVKHTVERVVGPVWHESQVQKMVDELAHNRQLMVEQPARVLMLICLQLTIFTLHSVALLAILHGLGVSIAPLAALAAYGLALIVSTYTLLPAGGGTVEAALTVGLTVQGVPLEAAIGASVLFRLLSFWLLLPIGAICYRMLLRHTRNQPRVATTPKPGSEQEATGRDWE
jgi:putative heme transporter